MTNPAPIFTASCTQALSDRQSQGASSFPVLVSLTVTAEVVYTDVRCTARRESRSGKKPCKRWMLAVPGVAAVTIRQRSSMDDCRGEGIIVQCDRCGARYEVTLG